MKNVKQKMVAITMALTFSSLSALASGVGNGGVSVVCRNQADMITSAQVLDIYEGEVRFGRKYDNVRDADTKVELAQLKLAKHPVFLEEFQEELAKVRAIMIFIPKGNRILPTNDAFPVIQKEGCKFEQLANYTEENELLVSEAIYDKLDEVNKAALLVHETVYAIFRKYSEAKDSQISRKLTAHILAKNPDQKVIDAIIEKGFGNQPANGLRACGTNGSVEERIKNCNRTKGNFALVARTKEGKEVYKDLNSGLLWGDRLPATMTHYNAEKACNASLAEVARISDLAWRLPSKQEYDQAEKFGIREAVANMNTNEKTLFWSSSVHPNVPDGAWLFNSETGETLFVGRNYSVPVRCVGW